MKTRVSESTQRMLMLLKLDARRLFERIKYRAPEYMYDFSLKRTRDHFPEIFTNRYDTVAIKELMLCGPEVLVGLDQYYSKVDEMRWYLNHTQDMPNRVEDRLNGHIRELEKYFQTLNLYIDAEMGLIPETPAVEEAPSLSGEENFLLESDNQLNEDNFFLEQHTDDETDN